MALAHVPSGGCNLMECLLLPGQMPFNEKPPPQINLSIIIWAMITIANVKKVALYMMECMVAISTEYFRAPNVSEIISFDIYIYISQNVAYNTNITYWSQASMKVYCLQCKFDIPNHWLAFMCSTYRRIYFDLCYSPAAAFNHDIGFRSQVKCKTGNFFEEMRIKKTGHGFLKDINYTTQNFFHDLTLDSS